MRKADFGNFSYTYITGENEDLIQKRRKKEKISREKCTKRELGERKSGEEKDLILPPSRFLSFFVLPFVCFVGMSGWLWLGWLRAAALFYSEIITLNSYSVPFILLIL
jgi:hypothetical protein